MTPRLIAVDDVRAAAADMHFSQTRAVLDATAGSRDDYMGDHAASCRRCTGSTLAATAADRRALAKIHAAVDRANAVDTRMFGLVAAGRKAQAVAVMNDRADAASDGIVEALSTYQASLRAERGPSRRAGRLDVAPRPGGRSCSSPLAATVTAAALATMLIRRDQPPHPPDAGGGRGHRRGRRRAGRRHRRARTRSARPRARSSA